MRIVYLHQYYLTPDQNGGVRSHQFATALARRGHDVHVVSATTPASCLVGGAPGDGPGTTVVDGLTVHRLAVDYDHAMGDARRMLAFASFAVRSMRLARRLRGDAVVASSTPLTIALPGIAATAGRRSPLVFEVRDAWPEVPIALGSLRNPLLRGAALLLERAAYRASSTVVALSPGMADSVRRTGHPADRLEVVPNISDVDRFDPARADAEAFLSHHPDLRGRRLVVYCGTLGRANDLTRVVPVARALRDRGSDVTIVLVGTGPERGRIEAEARRAGVLGSSVVLVDPVRKADLPDVYAASALALSCTADVPALAANSANKFFDALAAHRPVATTYGGWQAEVLAETGAGFRLARDPARAAAELVAFLDDDARTSAARAAAGRLARERYSLELLSRRFCDIVERDARAAGTTADRPTADGPGADGPTADGSGHPVTGVSAASTP